MSILQCRARQQRHGFSEVTFAARATEDCTSAFHVQANRAHWTGSTTACAGCHPLLGSRKLPLCTEEKRPVQRRTVGSPVAVGHVERTADSASAVFRHLPK